MAMAGGCRRHINVKDADVRLVDPGFDALKFDVGVEVEGDVDGGEGDGVVDEEAHPAPPAALAILADEVVAWDGRVVVVVQLCFLDGGDADAIGVEVVAEIIEFSEDAVAIPL